MRNSKIKLLIITFILVVMLLPLTVLAANENDGVAIVYIGSFDYVMYVDGYLDKSFTFAFSDSESSEPDSSKYIVAGRDAQDENYVAYVDQTIFNNSIDGKTAVYLWIKEGGVVKKTIKLDITDAIDSDIVDLINTTSKRIGIATDQKKEESEVNGIKITKTVGIVKITDQTQTNYSYNLVKLPQTTYDRFVEVADKITSATNMYEKLLLAKEFANLYNTLLPKSGWVSVGANGTINQPENSNNEDQYVLWLKSDTSNDVYFLKTIKSESSEEVKTETITTNSTSKLPITYDSIALFVILFIIVLLLVFVFVKMQKSKKQSKH